mgnify:FL=1
MNHTAIDTLFKGHPRITEGIHFIKDQNILNIQLAGLKGSSKSLAAGEFIKHYPGNHIIILSEKEEAAYFYNDLQVILNQTNIFFFPPSFKRSVQYYNPDKENIVLRTDAINAVSRYKEKQDIHYIMVTYPEALVERVITREGLQNNTLQLKKGEEISIDFITEVLSTYDFERVEFVYEPGQFAIRGSIVDIFSFSARKPYRIDFFGDEVESIRSFDIESQLSIDHYETVSVLPNLQKLDTEETLESLFEFTGNDITVWGSDLPYLKSRINDIFHQTDFEKVENIDEKWNTDSIPDKNRVLVTGNKIMGDLSGMKVIELTNHPCFDPVKKVDFQTSMQPHFHKNFEILGNDLVNNHDKGYQNFILSDSEKQFDRLTAIFNEIQHDVNFQSVNKTLHEGFIDHDIKICCYTDHQIFERYHKFRLNKQFAKKEQITINQIHDLHPGDYVVHIDHGIGKFGGLEQIDVNGKTQEAIKLVFKDNDTLYVNIHSLHRISKYKGKDSTPPKIHKLGTGTWQKQKQKAKSKVKDIARELINLYARRKSKEGYQFSPDTYLQKELEASFIYEDTPDQEKATKMLKEGMESPHPMDMLICGDVGFGKTEIAIRAAFKAAADSKQVAILAPTTILTLQHYQTFRDRLKDFPCNIDYISRLKPAAKQKESIEKLKEGKTDIIIGTHRMVGKDIHFKDLGLLVIDEEQKFGVSTKEKLKNLKLEVDTLTLTATPIPRTLQFSLMGVRDLSIINTPPPNRYPISTEVHSFNEDIIREAILHEIERDGQVFFIHNRVENIEEMQNLVKKVVPEARTVAAHGQMEGTKLEKIMLDFISEKYDVLVATTIIESGLDISNANTIIINNAHHFGLSDLHQLRGRVGRSNKKAFCYLLAPPVSVLTTEARRRLKAIEDFSELGSGFNIAMQDLDIRGAGNLLGGEQSGFITDIGFETYHRILNEALQELKENEFRESFEEEKPSEPSKQISYVSDCHIDTDLEIRFPEDYIDNITERIKLYRELDNLEDENQLKDFEFRLKDRFGEIPPQTYELLNAVRMRWTAEQSGIEKIFLKNNKMILYFISNPDSMFFKSDTFSNILNHVQKNPTYYQLKEQKNRLSLTVNDVKSVNNALDILRNIQNNEKT